MVKAYNGSPFSEEEYTTYVKTLGIKAKFATRRWPQGNAEIERFMENRFLLQYRTTPHSTTNVLPAELLFNGKVKGKLPFLQKRNIVNRHREARENEISKQLYNKQYTNRRNVTKSNLKVGDYVLVKQQRQNKLIPNFNETPYTITHRCNSRVIARNEIGHIITRNLSHFKSIPKPTNNDRRRRRQYK